MAGGSHDPATHAALEALYRLRGDIKRTIAAYAKLARQWRTKR